MDLGVGWSHHETSIVSPAPLTSAKSFSRDWGLDQGQNETSASPPMLPSTSSPAHTSVPYAIAATTSVVASPGLNSTGVCFTENGSTAYRHQNSTTSACSPTWEFGNTYHICNLTSEVTGQETRMTADDYGRHSMTNSSYYFPTPPTMVLSSFAEKVLAEPMSVLKPALLCLLTIL